MEKQKVFFVQQIGEGEFETESMWCLRDGDNFIVDNIPFVAKRISLGDTIKAEYDQVESVFYFDDFVGVSGNTTVRIYFDDVSTVEQVREKLSEMGCSSEYFLERRILAVNIPRDVSYAPIKTYLDSGEVNEWWQYEESCLAHEY